MQFTSLSLSLLITGAILTFGPVVGIIILTGSRPAETREQDNGRSLIAGSISGVGIIIGLIALTMAAVPS